MILTFYIIVSLVTLAVRRAGRADISWWIEGIDSNRCLQALPLYLFTGASFFFTNLQRLYGEEEKKVARVTNPFVGCWRLLAAAGNTVDFQRLQPDGHHESWHKQGSDPSVSSRPWFSRQCLKGKQRRFEMRWTSGGVTVKADSKYVFHILVTYAEERKLYFALFVHTIGQYQTRSWSRPETSAVAQCIDKWHVGKHWVRGSTTWGWSVFALRGKNPLRSIEPLHVKLQTIAWEGPHLLALLQYHYPEIENVPSKLFA